MTVYATHRFSVGQQVIRSDEAFEVMAQIDGPNGPEYRLRSGTSETVASERERNRAGLGPRDHQSSCTDPTLRQDTATTKFR